MSGEDSRRKAEVLRYLRYRGGEIEADTDALVEACMRQLRAEARPQTVWRVYGLREEAEGIALAGTGLLLPGAAIVRHLADCEQGALLAATLGAENDRLLQRAFLRDMVRGVILDAAANQYIEEICDGVNAEIAAAAARDGYGVTSRFSPGYGDLPLEVQPGLLALLNAERRIGLTVTASNMLLPQKSVTAIIGFRRGPAGETVSRCAECVRRQTCEYRRVGHGCPGMDSR
jgi:hypothetical protein